MRGRPGYTPELATKICDQLSRGRSLKDICVEQALPMLRRYM